MLAQNISNRNSKICEKCFAFAQSGSLESWWDLLCEILLQERNSIPSMESLELLRSTEIRPWVRVLATLLYMTVTVTTRALGRQTDSTEISSAVASDRTASCEINECHPAGWAMEGEDVVSNVLHEL